MTDKKFAKDVKECRELQQKLARTLEVLADELDDQQRKFDKAKLGFASTGAAAGIMTIVGLALAPVSFGASLGLSIAGGVIGGLSAVGNISSVIADKVMSSTKIMIATTLLAIYSAKIMAIESNLPNLKKILSELAKSKVKTEIEESELLTKEMKTKILTLLGLHEKNTDVPSRLLTPGTSLGFTGADLTQSIILASILVIKAASAAIILTGMITDVGPAADVRTKVVLSTAEVARSFALAGLDGNLGDIIYYSIKIKRKRPGELATKIRMLAQSLK